MKKDKVVKMVEIELDLEDDVIDGVVAFALEAIKNDRQALINYGVNKMLKQIIETDGKCLKGDKKCKTHTKKPTNKPKK